MSDLRDFDLNVKEEVNDVSDDDKITSHSLCTPGCKTGILQTCAIKSISCNVHISK